MAHALKYSMKRDKQCFFANSQINFVGYLEKKMPEVPAVFIYLTDGYSDSPSIAPGYPGICCIMRDGVKPVKWGDVKIGKNDRRTIGATSYDRGDRIYSTAKEHVCNE